MAFLINQSLNKSDYISITEIDGNYLLQMILAIICLGFIYYPKITLSIFKDESSTSFSSLSTKMVKLINLLKFNILIKAPYLNILLNKCIILGIFRFWLNYINYFKENEYIKINLFIIISNIMFNQQTVKTNNLKVLTNKEIKCNFIGENEDEEEDVDLHNQENSELDKKIEMTLKNNDMIINCDELKIFSQIVKYIRKYDSKIYELFIRDIGDYKKFENLLLTRNLKVQYKEKDYIICRKILKLIEGNNK